MIVHGNDRAVAAAGVAALGDTSVAAARAELPAVVDQAAGGGGLSGGVNE